MSNSENLLQSLNGQIEKIRSAIPLTKTQTEVLSVLKQICKVEQHGEEAIQSFREKGIIAHEIEHMMADVRKLLLNALSKQQDDIDAPRRTEALLREMLIEIAQLWEYMADRYLALMTRIDTTKCPFDKAQEAIASFRENININEESFRTSIQSPDLEPHDVALKTIALFDYKMRQVREVTPLKGEHIKELLSNLATVESELGFLLGRMAERRRLTIKRTQARKCGDKGVYARTVKICQMVLQSNTWKTTEQGHTIDYSDFEDIINDTREAGDQKTDIKTIRKYKRAVEEILTQDTPNSPNIIFTNKRKDLP